MTTSERPRLPGRPRADKPEPRVPSAGREADFVPAGGRSRSALFLPFLLASVLAGLCAFAPEARAQAPKRARYGIKIATVAPEGSTWMNVMTELDRKIREETDGAVGLRFYPGGIQGDEPVVLRKIRTGQLQGGGFTGVGLGEIAPSLRVLELPFLFENEAEVEAVHQALDPVFDQKLKDAGFTLLGWAEVGFVYLYSKEPVATAEDLRGKKVWLWEGDPLAEAFLKSAGVSPVPLALPDVLTALQTGLVDVVYTTPLAAIALQWFTRVSYVTDVPLTFSIGAVVITNQAWDKIPVQYQPVVHDLARTYFDKLRAATAEDNRKSQEVIAQSGVKDVRPTPAEVAKFQQMGEEVRREMIGKLYDAELLDRVVQVVDQTRAAAPGSPAGGSAGVAPGRTSGSSPAGSR